MDKDNVSEVKRPDLNKEIDNFCNEYYERVLKPGWEFYCNGLNRRLLDSPAAVKNLIEKFAVWYEMRYPNYTIEEMFSGTNYYGIYEKVYKHTDEYSLTALLDRYREKYSDKGKNVDEIMFENNNYITSNFDADSDARKLSWGELLNAKAFIKSLPYEERWVLKIPKYDISEIRSDKFVSLESIVLGTDGKVLRVHNLDKYLGNKISEYALIGKSIDEVIQIFEKNDKVVPSFIRTYKDFYDARAMAREKFFHCVMYRIIERGGLRVGPRRALLFAKEFKTQLFIPLMFGIDTRDENLGIFIEEYLLAGGSPGFVCFDDYFEYVFKHKDKVAPITLFDSSIRSNMARAHTYTDYRKELYIRLMNALSNNINPEELKTAEKEEVMRLRLERKLAKINNNK